MVDVVLRLADLTGLPNDQVRFLVSQVIALVFGIIYRKSLKACQQNALKRHIVSTFVGLCLGFFCFERFFLHILLVSLVTYVSLHLVPRTQIHLAVFGFVITYLSGLHVYFEIYHYGEKNFDITSPFMILSQKLTYIAFSLNDALKPVETLTESQRKYLLKDMPSFLEFFSYIFNFHGVIVGPACDFKDYIEFINGENFSKHKKPEQIKEEEAASSEFKLTVKSVIFKKALLLSFLVFVYFNSANLPLYMYMTNEVLSKPLLYRTIYLTLCQHSQRFKYYAAFTITDIVNNASGFGFNGYDQKGNAKWDLLTNVNIFEIETSTNIKSVVDNWHITTSTWLRRIAFERLPSGKTLGVFVLSAFWHGFYPGYYMTFVLAAILVYVGRGIRRNIRPFFLKKKSTKFFYDLMGWLVTWFAINYCTAPFILLEAQLSIKFYNSMYWLIHIMVVLIAFALPGQSFKSKTKQELIKQQQEQHEKKLE